MALAGKKDQKLKLAVQTLQGDEVFLICRQPTDEERDKFRRKRVKFKRGKPAPEPAEDVKFISMLLVGCENIQIKEGDKIVELDPEKHPNWRQLIDRDWKISAASAFADPLAEVAGAEGDDEDGNFSSTDSESSS